jgi:multimeric flavodoxin WrbA
MKVLGIVASYRRLGNTEILVKEALMGAQEQGAEVDIIRWTDYKILPCEGDATCMFMGRECKNKDKDDHDYLLKKMYQFDGVIFGAPCYILEVAAIVKQFIDRLFVLSSQPSQMRGKPAGIIIPYATRGWTSYAFLQPTILLKNLGMEIIDQVLIHIQAMAEATNDQRALDKAHKIGVEVATAIKTGNNKYLGDAGICPVAMTVSSVFLKIMRPWSAPPVVSVVSSALRMARSGFISPKRRPNGAVLRSRLHIATRHMK